MGRLTFEKLDRFHVERLRAGMAVEAFGGEFPDEALWTRWHGEAALLGDQVVGAGGLIERGPGRFFAWTLISDALPQTRWPEVMVRLRQTIERVLADGAQRIEAETWADWDQGARLLLALGFRPEGVLRHAMPDGKHAMLFARTRQDAPTGSLRYEASLEVALRCWDQDVWLSKPTPMKGLAPGRRVA